MAEVLFYQLTTRSLEATLPGLLERTLGRGWRAVVRCGSEERREAIDRALWTYRDDSFLPHGSAADPEPERQPIYLTVGAERPNAPQVAFYVDGMVVAPDEIGEVERACVIFSQSDPEGLAAARAAWKALSAAGVPAVYWAEDADGRFVEKARSAAAPPDGHDGPKAPRSAKPSSTN